MVVIPECIKSWEDYHFSLILSQVKILATNLV